MIKVLNVQYKIIFKYTSNSMFQTESKHKRILKTIINVYNNERSRYNLTLRFRFVSQFGQNKNN